MSVKVKICGLNSREAAEAALSAGADFGGLVFFPASPRHVSLDQARHLAAQLRGRVRSVALMVDPSDAAVQEMVEIVAPDLIQLHGNETPTRVASIGALAGLPIIKVLAVAESGDTARARAYEEVAEYILFDAKADSLANRPGGLGAAFDWRLLSGVSLKRPWGLAGGLTPENVARAIQVAGPHFVDTSSGVEDSPGRKSRERIAAFLKAARNAQYTDAKTGAA
jgi:phosphoribosylanthranilate isomerase